jgi:hypothetical protein
MKIFKNIDWERVKIEVFSLENTFLFVLSLPLYFYIIRLGDVHIEPAIADYIMDLIGVVLYAGAFIIYIITDEKFKKNGRVKRRSDERDGKIEISVERFKTLVEELEALPKGIRGDRVDMRSYSADMGGISKPTFGTDGGLSGLICIVANRIPELEKLYSSLQGLDFYIHEYDFCCWEVALYDFLECDFSRWAEYNPKTWGNPYGWHMFESAKAFGKDHGDALTHDEIINHLRNVCNRLEKSNTSKPTGKLSNLFSKIKYKIQEKMKWKK